MATLSRIVSLLATIGAVAFLVLLISNPAGAGDLFGDTVETVFTGIGDFLTSATDGR